jgi:hypothetical protein
MAGDEWQEFGPGGAREDGSGDFGHRAFQLTGPPHVDLASRGLIGLSLKSMYDDLLNQPLPERFRDLVGRLEGDQQGPGDGV